MTIYIIYRILNLRNRKFYIGKTRKTLKERWKQHKNSALYNKCYLYRAMRKHGRENFEIKQIDTAYGLEHSRFLEDFYTKYYNTLNPKYGYNLILGELAPGKEYMEEETLKKLAIRNHQIVRKRKNRYRGVFKVRKAWTTRIWIDGKFYSKSFHSEIEAAKAYDIVNYFKFKDDAILNFPENIKIYKDCDFNYIIQTLFKKNTKTSSYYGVSIEKGKYKVSILGEYFGMYQDELEAATISDKMNLYLKNDIKSLNFPNIKYNLNGLKEEYDKIKHQIKIRSKTIGIYNNTEKCKKRWKFAIRVKGIKYRSELFDTELEAAKAFDMYIIKNNLDLRKLNFPRENYLV